MLFGGVKEADIPIMRGKIVKLWDFAWNASDKVVHENSIVILLDRDVDQIVASLERISPDGYNHGRQMYLKSEYCVSNEYNKLPRIGMTLQERINYAKK